MQYLVVYAYVQQLEHNYDIGWGNAFSKVTNEKPTKEDVRKISKNIEKEIGKEVCILNMIELSG